MMQYVGENRKKHFRLLVMVGVVPDHACLLHLGNKNGVTYYVRHRLLNGWIMHDVQEVAGKIK